MTKNKKKFQPGGGKGGEGGDCGSDASIRISWVMVYRVQEVGKGLKGVDYSLHCSSAFNTVDWGKGEKIRHYIVRAWGEGGGGGVVLENFHGAVQHPIRDQYEIFPVLFQT